jgi:diguanylate cyclase (GGDEF)-like protein
MRPVSTTTSELERLIRRDQLEAVRASLLNAIPTNMLLGLASTLVAMHAGHSETGLIWLGLSTAANLLRIGLCIAPCSGLARTEETSPKLAAAAGQAVDRQLNYCVLTAWLSGCVWAFLPVLCAGYTSSQTLFYLTVTCGITAGSVTHGIAFARIPAGFITLPLLSVAGCLVAAGGFDRICLAATVLLYLVALLRSTAASQTVFREASRLKNEARALAEAMRLRATHDDLTGLLNRTGFAQAVENTLAAPRDGVCLLLLDLDGFKSVNDVYGHKTGDRVLVEVARRLRVALPAGCHVARLGGDEFAVLHDAKETGETPTALAKRLIHVVAQRFESFDTGRLGVSIGVCDALAESLTQLLSHADEALYAAKAGGRNRYRLFDQHLRSRLEMRRDCERDLSCALTEGALEVWFQPIFGGGGRRVASLEALIRWRHPIHGWVPPSDIIAAAAMAGLTESILRFVVEQVCTMLQALRARGMLDIGVAMNVSPGEMAQTAVDQIILERLRVLGLPPAAWEVEITEETTLDIEAVRDKLAALSRAGIRIALDDFGAGYSSLAYLRQLRADRLKIDRGLVTGLSDSEDKRGLVQTVLGLGETQKIEVVAEGVESAADLTALQALGCTHMQGYHLSRPKPAAELLEWLTTSQAA